MNIKKFKEGNLITRINATKNGDRSYMNDLLEFVGIDKEIIFLIKKDWSNEYKAIKLSTNWWSEGWDYFPETMWQKTKARAKELAKDLMKIKK